eukprot:GILJ01002114.1.p1 GENE.GILJ01002114.1~~GILJ01002114.1.p1  ORF type:complete len:601 (+),score=89.02 GILJ01002114.1:57-1859(+)
MSSVVVHLYDLSNGMARQFSRQLIGKEIAGIWHTGVVVYGKEFYFGGGICEDPPSRTPYGTPVEEISIGTTEIPEEVFYDFLREISPRFTAATYHLLEHNCNNFSDEVCQFLTGHPVPGHITGLPTEVMDTPFGAMIRPFVDSMMSGIQQQSHPLFAQSMQPAAPTFRPSVAAPPATAAPSATPSAAPFPNPWAAGAAASAAAPASGGLVTNLATADELARFISSNMAAVVDFWSPTCGPCIRIKPTYQQWAAEYQSRGVAFAAVDTSTSTAASNIRAVPTFRFFFNGKQIDEIVGADQTGIKNSIDRLVQQRVNTHRHQLLALSQLRPNFQTPVLFETYNAEPIFKKLRAFGQARNCLDADYDAMLTDLSAFFANHPATSKPKGFPEHALAAIDRLADTLPLEELFPVLDIMRIAVLYPVGNQYYSQGTNVSTVLRKCMLTDNAATVTPKAVQMLTLRLLTNMFAHETGILLVSSASLVNDVIEASIRGLRSEDKSTRFAASTLLYNLRVYATNKQMEAMDSELAMNALVAMSSALEQEADEETVYGELMCLARWVYCADSLVEIGKTLDCLPVADKWKQTATTQKVKNIAGELSQLLQ